MSNLNVTQVTFDDGSTGHFSQTPDGLVKNSAFKINVGVESREPAGSMDADQVAALPHVHAEKKPLKKPGKSDNLNP